MEGEERVVEVFRAATEITDADVLALESLIFEAILDRVRALSIDGPAYALLLVEGDDYDAVPPELAIGLERERNAWLADAAVDVRERSWSPEDLSIFDGPGSHLDDPAIEALAARFRAGLRAGGSPEPAHRLNVRVARRLNDDSSRISLRKTDDFAVVVVGLDRGIARAEVETYVPGETLEMLRARGWV